MVGFKLIFIFGFFLFFSFDVFAESNKPKWKDLNPQQQEILGPLAESWDQMESARKKKWLGIAKRYPKMTLQEQQRIQSQMLSWHALTAEQRIQARERFKKIEQLPAEKRKEIKQRWYEYEQLPEGSAKKL